MFGDFKSHKTDLSFSSKGMIDYLSKENKEGNFFSSDYSLNNKVYFNSEEVCNNLDSNRGSKSLKESNFYLLNISPSEKELLHIENLAIKDLESLGLIESICLSNDDIKEFYLEQKNELIDHYLKLYTQDVLKEYAKGFKESVYVEQDNLPTTRQDRDINKIVNDKIDFIIQDKGYNESFLKDNYINKPFVSDNINNHRECFLVEDLEDKGSYYTFSYEGCLLSCNKDLCEVSTEGLLINNDRMQHYLNEALRKENERMKPINVDISDGSFENFTFKGKEKEVFKFNYSDSKLGTVNISIDSKNYIVNDGKVIIPTHVYNFHVNKELEYRLKEVIEPLKQEIKCNEWKLRGFNPEKRELTDKDLMYYATIENNRTYKRTNSKDLEIIDYNNSIKKEIEIALKNNNIKLAKQLESSYRRDQKSKEIIFEGVSKGGNQKHIHVVISRHDKTTKNANFKVSLSPMANNRTNDNRALRGFNRSEFYNSIEKIFDAKFDYNRNYQETYLAKNDNKKLLKNTHDKENLKNVVKGKLNSKLKEYSGYSELRREISPLTHLKEINPISEVRKELNYIPLPTKFPKSKIDLIVKSIKAIIQGLDNGISR